MRARTSSERLVSCVVSAVIASGQSRWRSSIAVWKSVGEIAKMSGSAPTSLREVSREVR